MTQTVRYLSLALETIKLYQNELIKHLRKNSVSSLLEFKRQFDHHLSKIKQIQLMKSIHQDKITNILGDMEDLLEKSIRIRKTSHSERYNYRANLGTRQSERMRLTGAFTRKQNRKQQDLSEIQEIIRSYKICENPGPKMKMKWRISGQNDYPIQSKQKVKKQSFSSNNIELLSITIPEIENRIKKLSISQERSPNKSFIGKQRQNYRTIETRGHHPRIYIPRLF